MTALHLSKIGNKMTNKVGVRAIMHDIQEVLNSDLNQYVNLSAGNPAILPQVYEMWEEALRDIVNDKQLKNLISQYGSSYGTHELIDCIREYFFTNYRIKLDREQVLITSGSQNLFFLALNSFCGTSKEGRVKKALIPMLPDYAGYSGVALEESVIEGIPPILSKLDHHTFRYEFNKQAFKDKIAQDPDIGAVVLSRPNNPSGNILSEEAVQLISQVCKNYHIPLLIDSAYAPPFPAINFIKMDPIIHDNIIHCMSLSKAGLPGERIGIAIGKSDFIKVMEAFQSNMLIHSSRLGQRMVVNTLKSGKLPEVSANYIRTHYKQKHDYLKNLLTTCMPDDIPWYLHKAEGSLFGWLWLEGLPFSDSDLYNKLKAENLIVVPGGSFFHGSQSSSHNRECIRISLTATDEELKKGIHILSSVVKKIYSSNTILETGKI
ncbi:MULTISPECIES: valine--pyruvate transaminase [Priestia]|uniref:Valine--pyruvate transaminase n=1 Tax=Priestia megaterium TaxID=1404 RepID=A0A6M6DVX3_PRIMG|nr:MULTISPECIES: valine--pyruvate transaminase [Priestia]KLV30810.1 valine--pyruvate aminotransferase [Priestia megaterium]MBY0197026.1 valine--pyruvate transaminase [Priestia megaterium]MCE4090214.1 valine--pyruvate transaminase [Priestia megaterium]MCU7710788.1 valine--pyruvate transaminase [Priestia megaterium]MCW1045808.1 valine--pyruvate transaminase [Priestia sp. JV24]